MIDTSRMTGTSWLAQAASLPPSSTPSPSKKGIVTTGPLALAVALAEPECKLFIFVLGSTPKSACLASHTQHDIPPTNLLGITSVYSFGSAW